MKYDSDLKARLFQDLADKYKQRWDGVEFAVSNTSNVEARYIEYEWFPIVAVSNTSNERWRCRWATKEYSEI